MRRNPKIFRQHLERYVFSTIHCNKKRVLDLGSKEPTFIKAYVGVAIKI